VGLLLISPYIVPNTQDPIDYFNHFGLLASIEGMFGVSPLGYASAPTQTTFGFSVFKNYFGCSTPGRAPPC
jgi:hypothetical protein